MVAGCSLRDDLGMEHPTPHEDPQDPNEQVEEPTTDDIADTEVTAQDRHESTADDQHETTRSDETGGDEPVDEPVRDEPPVAASMDDDARWRRPRDGRLIAGVAAGIADQLGMPVWLVRLGFVVAAVAGGFGLAAYLGAWALMPSEGERLSATDDWRLRFDEAETTSEKTGLVLIALALLVAIGATGILAAPLAVATVLVVAGLALMRPAAA
jgi:phage shock protein PspC (stress-responsive transcriptional regulator)